MKDLSKIAEIVSFVAVFAKSEIEKSIVEVQANLYKKLKEDLQSVTQQINEESIEAERMFKDNVALKSDVSEAQDSAVYIAKGQIDQSKKRLTRIIEDTNTFLTNSISSLSDRQITAERALTDALQQTGLNFSDRLTVLLEDVNVLSESFMVRLTETKAEEASHFEQLNVGLERHIAESLVGLETVKTNLESTCQKIESNFKTTSNLINEDLKRHTQALSEAVIESNNALDVIQVAVLDESVSRIAQIGQEFEQSVNEAVSSLTQKIKESAENSVGTATNFIDSIRHNLTQDIISLKNSQGEIRAKVDSLEEKITQAGEDIKRASESVNPVILDHILSRARQHTDDAIARLPGPLKGDKGDPGKNGLQWIFEFDPRMQGLLRYRREDQREWQFENLRGPPGESIVHQDSAMDRMTAAGTSILNGWAGGVVSGSGPANPRVFTYINTGDRSFNTPFKLDLLRDAFVTYSVQYDPTIDDVNNGGSGMVQLQVSSDGLRWLTISTTQINLSGLVLFGSMINLLNATPVSGYIPAGYFCQMTSSGTLTPTLITGQEVLD